VPRLYGDDSPVIIIPGQQDALSVPLNDIPPVAAEPVAVEAPAAGCVTNITDIVWGYQQNEFPSNSNTIATYFRPSTASLSSITVWVDTFNRPCNPETLKSWGAPLGLRLIGDICPDCTITWSATFTAITSPSQIAYQPPMWYGFREVFLVWPRPKRDGFEGFPGFYEQTKRGDLVINASVSCPDSGGASSFGPRTLQIDQFISGG